MQQTETSPTGQLTQVEKLKQLGWLGDVRQRLGAEDGKDTSEDARINQMSNSDLVAKWAGWHLGDEGWWHTMKVKFDDLQELSK